MDTVTRDDLQIIQQQIGRAPRGVIGVPTRCGYGYPVVALVYPVIDGKPFPTIHWLTCPFLRLAIDRIEARGGVGDLERRVAADGELEQALDAAHERVIRDRLALLTAEDREALERRGMISSLSERGIGGIRDRARIKCLHLHVATELASADPVGAIVLDRLACGRECDEKEVICSARSGRSRSPMNQSREAPRYGSATTLGG